MYCMYAHTHIQIIKGGREIRVLNKESFFKQRNLERLETYQRVLYMANITSQWLNIRLQLMGVAFVAFICVCSVAYLGAEEGSGAAVAVGLSLSYVFPTVDILNALVRCARARVCVCVCVSVCV
jgi:hypothetical protein